MAIATEPASTILTWETYLEEGFVGGSYDILEGVRHPMPGASWKHQRLVGNIYHLFRQIEREHHQGYCLLAPFDIVIRQFPLRTRQPDVFFISRARRDEAGGPPEEGALEVAPELIIEVLSPSETPRSLGDNLADFARIGTEEAWIVSPEAESVQVMRRVGDAFALAGLYAYGQELVSPILPDGHLNTAEIFGD